MSKTGAKRATLRDYNPRELVVHLMKSHPQAGADELFRLFRAALAGHFSNYQESVDRYCFDNQFRAINDEPPPRLKVVPPVSTAKQVAADRAKAISAAKERLREIAPVMFLKLPTPFGKPLGELTGKEGRKLGGWMGAAFRGVKDNQKLADAKSEDQLRQLWAKP